jgi:isocitrate lyase
MGKRLAIPPFELYVSVLAGEAEFAAAEKGFTAVKHQREVGTGYFDAVTQAIQQGQSSTTALHGSTEDEQFFDKKVA